MTPISFLAYRPFLDPLPVWDYWFLLILPLCARCRGCLQVDEMPLHVASPAQSRSGRPLDHRRFRRRRPGSDGPGEVAGKIEMQNDECRMQNAECRMQNAE